ncbi:MAG: Uracil-DNA glycosylase, family 1, partial [uncultured Gemmatimonadetes bacterium]
GVGPDPPFVAARAGRRGEAALLRGAAPLPGRGAPHADRLPLGGRGVLAAGTDAVRPRQGADPGPGPVPWAQAGARPGLLRAPRGAPAAVAGQRLQGAARRPGVPRPQTRLPGALGGAGRAAAERGAHRAPPRAQLAQEPRMGALHRCHHPRGEPAGEPCRLRALGRVRGEEGGADRREPARDPALRAPVALLGGPWILWQPPVLRRQRGAGRERAGTAGLVPARDL